MTDRDASRPSLPDPQHDRHVSFPDDAPGPADATAPAAVSLPPEAWAPHPSSAPPRSAAASAHTRQPAPTGWSGPMPSRRTRNNRRGAGWLLALVIGPMFLGMMHDGGEGGMTADENGFSIEGPMGGPDVGHQPVGGIELGPDDKTTPIGGLIDPSTVPQPVPVDVTELRVEVVGHDGETVDFEARAADGTIENTFSEGLPLARIARFSTGQAHGLVVSATPAEGTGPVQCRVWAGTVLVAVDTGSSSVRCELSW